MEIIAISGCSYLFPKNRFKFISGNKFIHLRKDITQYKVAF